MAGVPGAALRRAVTASSEALAVRLNESGIHVNAEFGLYGADPRTPELRKRALGVDRHRGAEDDIYGRVEGEGVDETRERTTSRSSRESGSRGRSRSRGSRSRSRSRSRSKSKSRKEPLLDSVGSQGSLQSLEDSASLGADSLSSGGSQERMRSAPGRKGSVTWADDKSRWSASKGGSGRGGGGGSRGRSLSRQSSLSGRVLSSGGSARTFSPIRLPPPISQNQIEYLERNELYSGITNQPAPRVRTGSASSRKLESLHDSDMGWEVEWSRELERRGISEKISTKFPGDSLLRDLPMGLEDTCERLLRAASLRR